MASDLWPPASYKMKLENSRPTACYFQWNFLKIWSNHFRAASFRSFLTSDLLSIGGSKCLSSRKKVSVLHLSVCSFGDQSSQLILWLERVPFPWSGLSSLGLTVQPWPLASAGQLSDLGWTPLQISENENSPTTKKLRYRALSPSEQAFRGSTEHLCSFCGQRNFVCWQKYKRN